MVSVTIQQDISVIPPMMSPMIGPVPRPASPNVHWPLPTTTTTTSATTTTTLPLPPQPQQGPLDPIIIKRMGELEELIANLVEENQALEERPTSGIRATKGTLHKIEHRSKPFKPPQVIMSANDNFSLHDEEELSLHDDASLDGSVPATNKEDAPAKPPQIITTNTLSNIKLPVLQKDDYDTWAMEMEHYLEYIDNEVWKVIQNGNSKKRIYTNSRKQISRNHK
ncbi:hypothetical protein Tco_0731251 [Tanacetum coccineum]